MVAVDEFSTITILMIKVFEVNWLPGHEFIIQVVVSCCGPGQSSPLSVGGGLLHVLVRVLVPSPHVTEHELHDAQIDHSPSTKDNICLIFFCQCHIHSINSMFYDLQWIESWNMVLFLPGYLNLFNLYLINIWLHIYGTSYCKTYINRFLFVNDVYCFAWLKSIFMLRGSTEWNTVFCVLHIAPLLYVLVITHLWLQCRGVDNGAAGAAAAAPIIWLVVVIQKWQTFRRPKQIFFCLYECNLS